MKEFKYNTTMENKCKFNYHYNEPLELKDEEKEIIKLYRQKGYVALLVKKPSSDEFNNDFEYHRQAEKFDKFLKDAFRQNNYAHFMKDEEWTDEEKKEMSLWLEDYANEMALREMEDEALASHPLDPCEMYGYVESDDIPYDFDFNDCKCKCERDCVIKDTSDCWWI